MCQREINRMSYDRTMADPKKRKRLLKRLGKNKKSYYIRNKDRINERRRYLRELHKQPIVS